MFVHRMTRGATAMVEWTFPSVVRGYHVYKGTWLTWDAVIGEQLPRKREMSNNRSCFNCAWVQHWINFVDFHLQKLSEKNKN